jgi:hypothetical protein
MLGFAIPLVALLVGNILMSMNLLMPYPLNKPGILVCKFSLTRVGQTMTATLCFLLILMGLVPVHDLWSLHQQKEATTRTLTSKDRRRALFNEHSSCMYQLHCDLQSMH